MPRLLFTLSIFVLTGAGGVEAGDASADIEVYVTAKDTSLRLSRVETEGWREDLRFPLLKEPAVFVDTRPRYQTLVGIGGALTDAAAETFYKLPPAVREEVVTAYYCAEEGIGYTLGRTHINSCDFSPESYAYAEVPGDTALEHFSIGRDRRFRIPFIREAVAKTGGELKLFASPWSPPAWMKTNGQMVRGGKLKPEYRRTWADYYVRFLEAYAEEGVRFWGLTVQNEPAAAPRWESCIYSAEEERDFIRDFLGPALEASAFSDVNLIAWDHNRAHLYHRAQTILGDPEAARHVWGIGFHWYGDDNFENVRAVREAFPDTPLIHTEGCITKFDPDRLDEWQWGERYGISMIHDLNHGAAGWTDWNVMLDERGGPNHVGNFCYAPIIADTAAGTLTYMNSYYYIGHFSKFIRPGAERVAVVTSKDDLLATAFRNPNGRVASVVINLADHSYETVFILDGRTMNITMPPRSIQTIVARENLAP